LGEFATNRIVKFVWHIASLQRLAQHPKGGHASIAPTGESSQNCALKLVQLPFPG